MASIPLPIPSPDTDPSGPLRRWWPVAAILLATLLTRAVTFGDPILDYDEQLYLLVGDRILAGGLPYVDLWDRKPVGLFLFYAGVRALGGEGLVQYQAAAALCAAGTACLVWAMARRTAGDVPAVVAAVAYLLILNPLHGEGGQAAVIYNLLTAAAAAAAFRSNRTGDARTVLLLGLAATALMGVAIQFKYTPVVEGAFFGCWFLHRLRGCGATWPQVAAGAAAMAAVALLPTAAALAWYWRAGHLDLFVQANFLSVFDRAPFPAETIERQRRLVAIIAGPLIALSGWAAWRLWRRRGDAPLDAALLGGWCVAALVAFGMLGDFYEFYFITAALPLAVLASRVMDRERARVLVAFALLAWPWILTPARSEVAGRNREAVARLVSAIRPHVGTRCLYVHDGPTVLYLLTGACAPTRYIYPDHLTNPTEAPALGVDPSAEVARLLATGPGAIVTADRPLIPRVNPATRALVAAALRRDYRVGARVAVDRVYTVWIRRSAGVTRSAGAATSAPVRERS